MAVTPLSAMWTPLLLLVLCISAAYAQYPGPDPLYDHQNATYNSKYQPLVQQNVNLTMTPFFSPDWSIEVQTWLIGNATQYVDVGAPGWDGWSACLKPDGCTPSELREEEVFPVWQALINALHRGVRVRIMTNDYSNVSAPAVGKIDPLTFLSLNGATIRYFSSVTFLHTKYIGTETASSVSSVNFDFTSYMENREAGIIVSGPASLAIRQYINTTYNADFAIAVPFKVNQQYSSSDMKIILNSSEIKIKFPPAPDIDAYKTPLVTVTGVTNMTAFDSPDFAYNTILPALNTAKVIQVMIYQITNDDMCQWILDLPSSVQILILVSQSVFDPSDYESSQACYEKLYKTGLKIRLTSSVFQYSHQKFWLLDYSQLFMSTGNWGDSDYPNGSSTFPPYGQAGWRVINRDYTFAVNHPDVLSVFGEVFEKDYAAGTYWSPEEGVQLVTRPAYKQPYKLPGDYAERRSGAKPFKAAHARK